MRLEGEGNPVVTEAHLLLDVLLPSPTPHCPQALWQL